MRSLIILLIALLIIPTALGLGIAPSKHTITYAPGQLSEGTVRIMNENAQTIMLYVQSDLPFTLSTYTLEFAPGETHKDVDWRFQAPPDLPAGMHDIRIIAQQVTRSQGQISVVSAIETTYNVFVPYGDTYLHSRLYAPRDARNVIILELENRGTKDIASTGIDLTIRSGPDTYQQFTMERFPLKAGEKRYLTFELSRTLPAGYHIAEARIIYDGTIESKQEHFLVGDPKLIIHTIESELFRLGSISKLVTDIENPTYYAIPDIDVRLEILQDGQIRARYGVMESFEPRMRKAIPLYVDTDQLRIGPATVRVTTTHAMGTESLQREVLVEENRLAFTGMVATEAGGISPGVMLLIILGIIIVIITNIIILNAVRKKR